jgi:hypothetical protein
MMQGSAHRAPILVEPRSRKPSLSGTKVIGPARSVLMPWRASSAAGCPQADEFYQLREIGDPTVRYRASLAPWGDMAY